MFSPDALFGLGQRYNFRSVHEFEQMAEAACREWKWVKKGNPWPNELKVVWLAQEILRSQDFMGFALISPQLTHKVLKYSVHAANILGKKIDRVGVALLIPCLQCAERELHRRLGFPSSSQTVTALCLNGILEGPQIWESTLKNPIWIKGEEGMLVFSRIVFSLLFPEYVEASVHFGRKKTIEIEAPFLSESSMRLMNSITQLDPSHGTLQFFPESVRSLLEVLALCDLLAINNPENRIQAFCSGWFDRFFPETPTESTEETRQLHIIDSDARWTIETFLYLGSKQPKGSKEIWEREIHQLYDANPRVSYDKDMMLGRVLGNFMERTEWLQALFSQRLNASRRESLSTILRLSQERTLAGIAFRTICENNPISLNASDCEEENQRCKAALDKDPCLSKYVKFE